MSNVLRNIPSVAELLESPPLKSLVSRVSHNVVVSKVGQFLDDLRGQVQGATGVNIPSAAELAERIAGWIAAEERAGLRPVINATGVMLHASLGGPPLADEAVQAMAELAGGYASIDLDLATAQPSERSAPLARLLSRLTGAESAVIVNSVAAAGWITLAALAAGREVLVARGQVSELGDCRLPELALAAGARLREVGTTNKTRIDDFAAAAGGQSALLLRADAASYVLAGALEEPTLAELVSLGRRHNVPVVHDLGLGAILDVAEFGLPNQPQALQSIQAGVDLVLMAGDKLLGGPTCGIILGKRSLVQKIQRHPLLTAVRADPRTLAALSATLRLYEDPAAAARSVPLLALLATPLQNLRNRAERLGPQIAATGLAAVEIAEGETSLAGHLVPGQMLKTVVMSLAPSGGGAASLAAALRLATPSVIGRLESHKQADQRVVLDLRSVPPRSDVRLIAAFEGLPRSALTAGAAPQLAPA
jgi:L-seryl-tRNA(Ser) seleniumtransferase